MDYQGLGAEVANCDGGFVVFGEGAFSFFVEDFLGEEDGALNGEFGDFEFFPVGVHGCKRISAGGCVGRKVSGEVGKSRREDR